MIKDEMLKRLSFNMLDTLKNRFVNNGLNFSTLQDGNLKYCLVYSNEEKNLNLYCSYNFYSCLLDSVDYKHIDKKLKDALTVKELKGGIKK